MIDLSARRNNLGVTVDDLIMIIAKSDGTWGNIQYGDQWSLNRAKDKADQLLALVDGDIAKAVAIARIFY